MGGVLFQSCIFRNIRCRVWRVFSISSSCGGGGRQRLGRDCIGPGLEEGYLGDIFADEFVGGKLGVEFLDDPAFPAFLLSHKDYIYYYMSYCNYYNHFDRLIIYYYHQYLNLPWINKSLNSSLFHEIHNFFKHEILLTSPPHPPSSPPHLHLFPRQTSLAHRTQIHPHERRPLVSPPRHLLKNQCKSNRSSFLLHLLRPLTLRLM